MVLSFSSSIIADVRGPDRQHPKRGVAGKLHQNPPEPTSNSGPYSGSERVPTMASTPSTISWTRKP